jgi:bleomycin hydrolase
MSGRCWMFAALNTFRHLLIHTLNLDNFEFSYVYLFFFDKLERANSYLKWFIDNPVQKPGMRLCDYMLCDFMSDGGWWNTFANLINKYGIVPSNTMRETFQSDDSDEMNSIIEEHLDNAVNYIMKNSNKIDSEKFREKTIKNIYDILVKFLGEPPKKFDWQFSYINDEDKTVSIIMNQMSPHSFLKLIAPKINISRDFICLSHIPLNQLPFNKVYEIQNTSNTEDGKLAKIINVKLDIIQKSIMKSIKNGLAVWFAADVKKSFNWLHSALDDTLDDRHRLFGKIDNFSKGERILMRNIQSCHAMAITGFNVDKEGNPTSWQVENSWGYLDNETPGLDGFLYMSNSWFEKYMTNVVVHKKFLGKRILKLMKKKPIPIDPLEPYSNALRVGIYNVPLNYKEILKKKLNR